MILVCLGVGIFALAVYISAYIFIVTDGVGQMKISRGLLRTVLTWGYLKSSFRRFCNHHRHFFFGKCSAEQGKQAVDGRLISLQGEQQNLLDFVHAMPRGMALVLNMGSYT